MENNTPMPSEQPAPRLPAQKRELLFGAVTALTGLLLGNCLLFGGANLGFALALLGCLGAALVYLFVCGYRGDRYSQTLLVFSILIIPGFARSADGFVKFVLMCFLFVSINLGLTGLAGRNVRSTNGAASLLDSFRTAFVLGFGQLPESLRGVAHTFRTGGAVAKKSGAVLLGLGMAVPVLAIMIPLLMRSDAAFEGLLDLLPEIRLHEIILTVLFGGVAAMVLYTRTVALVHAKLKTPQARNLKKLSSLTMNTLLGAVCLLYCVYLLSQLAYFSGGFSGILPKGYTLAEYARRGFFEMGWLCAINLSVMVLGISLAQKSGSKAPLSTRLLCLFVGLVTLFLVTAAGAKMVLYICSYGMTRLRVLTMVVMSFLGLTTAVVSLWLFVPRLAYMKVIVLSAMVIGAAVLWTDVNTVVAGYNVDAYLSGRLDTVDLDYLQTLGSAAVPQLERLTQQAGEEAVVKDATYRLNRAADAQLIEDLRDWNAVDAAAEAILRNR